MRKILRQLVEGSAQNHRDNAELRFRGHADGPGHHVFRHALRRQHVPRMHQHGRAFIRAMMQKRHDAGIVEIFLANMVADLHAEMARPHASRKFLACGIDILQRNLAQRLQPAFALRAKLQRGVIEQVRAIERMFNGTIVGKQHRASRR